MLGDEGSGVWIAREAARLLMARTDDGAAAGELGEALLARAGVGDAQQLLGALHAIHEPKEWAALADVVFDTASTDAGARDIVHRAAGHLAQLVVPLGRLVDGPVVLAGGLILHQPLLEAEVRKLLPMRAVRLEAAPVEGAVRLAAELLR